MLFVINTSLSASCDQQMSPLTATSDEPTCIQFPVRGSGPHPHIAIRFGMEKLESCGYLMVKNFDDKFTRFDSMHERDRWTESSS